MNFLPDVYVICEVCGGRRYNHETLAVKYNGASIADLLEMPIADALPILENIPQVRQKLQTLIDVGLGYIHLGTVCGHAFGRRSAAHQAGAGA
jgi:excinuclease ABC subunit A